MLSAIESAHVSPPLYDSGLFVRSNCLTLINRSLWLNLCCVVKRDETNSVRSRTLTIRETQLAPESQMPSGPGADRTERTRIQESLSPPQRVSSAQFQPTVSCRPVYNPGQELRSWSDRILQACCDLASLLHGEQTSPELVTESDLKGMFYVLPHHHTDGHWHSWYQI